MKQAKKDKSYLFEGKYGDHTYPIQVIGRHVDVTDSMRQYAVDKLERLSRFGLKINDIIITMDIQKLHHIVSFIIDVIGTFEIKIKVTGTTDSMYSAIDQAMDRLEIKLRRYHKKLCQHHTNAMRESKMNIQVIRHALETEEINDAIEEVTLQAVEHSLIPHEIVSQESYAVKTLTNAEALMKIELNELPFLLYRSEEDLHLKVIYRREDGNYGIIEPEK